MANGKTHDKWGVIAAIAIAPFSIYIAAGCAIGTLWLSPDLDHHVRTLPRQRWGILDLLWLPYRKCIPHRSPLSHGLIIGTALRLAYIAAIALLILAALGLQPPVWSFVMAHRQAIALVVAGIELSAIVHYFLDWG